MTETSSSQVIDPRIIRTVRVLKENSQKQTEQIDFDKEKEDSFKADMEYKPECKKTNEPHSQTNLHRISIDGSVNKRRNTRELSEKISSHPSNSILSDSLTKEKVDINAKLTPTNCHSLKSKGHFVKNLMNDSSMKKYKAACLSLLKDDAQMSKLCADCNIMSNANSLELFLSKNFFSNSIFLYKLEMLLSGDQVMNKNYKEKFFKREMIKVLNQIYLDIQYQLKMEMLEKTFEEHFQLIEKFDFTHG